MRSGWNHVIRGNTGREWMNELTLVRVTLGDLFIRHLISQRIQIALHWLYSLSTELTFIWIPGLMNIAYHDIVNLAAKKATFLNIISILLKELVKSKDSPSGRCIRPISFILFFYMTGIGAHMRHQASNFTQLSSYLSYTQKTRFSMIFPKFSFTQTSISHVLTDLGCSFWSKNTQWIKTFHLSFWWLKSVDFEMS